MLCLALKCEWKKKSINHLWVKLNIYLKFSFIFKPQENEKLLWKKKEPTTNNVTHKNVKQTIQKKRCL